MTIMEERNQPTVKFTAVDQLFNLPAYRDYIKSLKVAGKAQLPKGLSLSAEQKEFYEHNCSKD